MAGLDWGWSIDVLGESGLGGCTGCEIWAESDCSRSSGYMVGTADFDRHYASILLDDDYVLESASLYGGKCQGSDGGDHVRNNCGCNPVMVSDLSADPSSFPIQKTFPTKQGGYTFTDHDMSTEEWTGPGYTVFPLDVPERQYVSAHLRVCPCPPS